MQVENQKKVCQARERIETLRASLAEFDHVCSGTVVKSMVRCGKPNCKCVSDPDARHGPYYQWNRMKNGKLVHSTITEYQAKVLLQAIKNYRRILKLLRKWEEETQKIINVN
jgi:hypothetical protein